MRLEHAQVRRPIPLTMHKSSVRRGTVARIDRPPAPILVGPEGSNDSASAPKRNDATPTMDGSSS